MAKLGVCQYKNIDVTPGPNNFAENERWLTHECLAGLLYVEPEDVDETDNGSHHQCDSCKREQSEATEATEDVRSSFALLMRVLSEKEANSNLDTFEPLAIRTR